MKFSIALSTLFFVFHAKGQNLIPNHSFEDINYCETRIPCSPAAWYSVSNIPYGYQNDLIKSIEGKHSIAFLIAFENEVRSYWQTMLLCNLQPLQEYIVSFDLYPKNIEFEPAYFGLYLSDTLFRSKNDTIIQKNLSVLINEQSLSSSKNGWYKVTLRYTATGKEKYLLLGNFNRASNTQILKKTGRSTKPVEYYVDNVIFKSADKNENKCKEYSKRNDSLYSATFRHADFQDKETPKIISKAPVLPSQLKSDTLILNKINFDFANDKLTSIKLIKGYFDNVDFSKIDKIEVIGYTDSIGKKSYNLNLSERRALSVKKYIVSTYKSAYNLVAATGKGIINDNKVLENNRRVEIRVYWK